MVGLKTLKIEPAGTKSRNVRTVFLKVLNPFGKHALLHINRKCVYTKMHIWGRRHK